MKNTYDVAVIGGGASGIMAAITAAKLGSNVILIEKNANLGRKIFATGNGRCNLTNKDISPSNYHGATSEFVRDILDQFNQHKAMGFFEDLGLVLKEEENGRIFPRTNQASSVVEALDYELGRNNVEVYTSSNVTSINKKRLWSIILQDGRTIDSEKIIVTTGGIAAPQFGSTGDGIYWAEKMGHQTKEQFPALVPLETMENWPKRIQGLKIEAEVTICHDDNIISKRKGDLLFTHYGISGPAIMSQTRYIGPLLEKESVNIKIDAYPEGSIHELDRKICKIFDLNGAKSTKNAMAGLAPINFISIVLEDLGIDESKRAARISKDERLKIAKRMKEIILTPKELRPFKEAQVSTGGVTEESLKTTLESKVIKNLYFAGEVIDVDADSGGFNLQWAWSSGYVAGKNAAG